MAPTPTGVRRLFQDDDVPEQLFRDSPSPARCSSEFRLKDSPKRSASVLEVDSVLTERVLQEALHCSGRLWEASTLLQLRDVSDAGFNPVPCPNAPHTLCAPRVAYTVVIPAFSGTLPRADRGVLDFLSRQGVPIEKVIVFVIGAADERECKKQLMQTAWESVRLAIAVGASVADWWRSLKHSLPDQEFLAIADPELSDVFWKYRAGRSRKAVVPLPPDGFEQLIFDSCKRMEKVGSNICGLQYTTKSMQVDGISTRGGRFASMLWFACNRKHSVNHCRHLESSVPLRYRMYCCEGPWCSFTALQCFVPPEAIGCVRPEHAVLPSTSVEALQCNRAVENAASKKHNEPALLAELDAQREDAALLDLVCRRADLKPEEMLSLCEVDKVTLAIQRLKARQRDAEIQNLKAAAEALSFATRFTTQGKVQAEVSARVEAERQAGVEAPVHGNAGTEAQRNLEAEAKRNVDAGANANIQGDAKPKLIVEVESQSQADAKTNARANAKAKAKARARAKAEAKVKVQPSAAAIVEQPQNKKKDVGEDLTISCSLAKSTPVHAAPLRPRVTRPKPKIKVKMESRAQLCGCSPVQAHCEAVPRADSGAEEKQRGCPANSPQKSEKASTNFLKRHRREYDGQPSNPDKNRTEHTEPQVSGDHRMASCDSVASAHPKKKCRRVTFEELAWEVTIERFDHLAAELWWDECEKCGAAIDAMDASVGIDGKGRLCECCTAGIPFPEGPAPGDVPDAFAEFNAILNNETDHQRKECRKKGSKGASPTPRGGAKGSGGARSRHSTNHGNVVKSFA